MNDKNINEKIIELYKKGLEISEIIVELNVTYKRVMKTINIYEENKKEND